MRKVKLNNDDLIQYLNTINTLKQYPTMSEYKEEYRRLRTDGSPLSEAKKFKSAHTELLRLDRKRKSLLEKFIEELNPVSHASALASRKLEKVQESIIYRKSLLEKSPDELVALLIKQRTEAALEFQRSVEQSLEQLSNISSEFEPSSQLRRKMAYKSVLRFSFEMVLIDCSNANIYYIINMLVCFKSIIRQYWTPFDPPFQTQDGIV